MEVKTIPIPLKEQYKGVKCDAPGCLMCGNDVKVNIQESQKKFGNFNFKSKEN